ncbi:MAG: cytochrome b5 domain-containing protein [Fervidobacterium sp.]|uniref:cytochrome b5 domain-containing protein n=1 Tax=Fervidobacterium sp. TaxID=1871331 RepID=UPI00404AD0B8
MSRFLTTAVILFVMMMTVFAGHLDSIFNISNFSGQYKIISPQILEKTSGWVSVEGVVYNLGSSAVKKHVKLSEIDSKLLTKDKIVGLLGITHSELSKYNGKNAPVMVSVGGIIYDLSNSKSWSGGNHKNQHTAGQDLTYDILKLSPHGISKIKSFPSYGVLVFTPDEMLKFDGKKQKKIYVSVYGIVYDATYSRKFSGGEHYGHDMGVDLTTEILSLQGHVNLLSKLYAIGLYVFDEKIIVKFDGKNNKPFVIVDDKVYDISKNSEGVKAGSVFTGTPRKEWLVVGYVFK